MTTIQRVVATGFKVGNLDVELGERALLVGPNGSGKSAVLEAIRVSILGFIPALGKRLQDVAPLMLGRQAAVTVYLSDGRAVAWEIRRSARGSLSSTVTCSWLPDGATQQEHAAAALELVADEETTVAEILDARTLLKATPAQRTQRIQGFIAAGSLGAEERVELVFDRAVRRLADAVDRAVPTASCVDMIPGTAEDGQHFGQRRVFDRFVDSMRSVIGKDGGSAAAIEWSRNAKNEAARDVREKKAARDELAARVEALSDVDPNALAAERDRLREVDRLISVEGYKAEQQEKQAKARERANAELDAAKQAMLEAEADSIDADKAAKAIPDLEAELAAARAWLEGAAEPVLTVPDELGKIDAEMARLDGVLAPLTDKIAAIDLRPVDDSDVIAAERRVAACKQTVAEIRGDAWAQIIAILDDLDDPKPVLPHRAIEAFEKIRAIAEQRRMGDPKAAAWELEKAEANLDEKVAVRAALVEVRNERIEQAKALEAERDAAIDARRAAYEQRAAIVAPIEFEHTRAVAQYQLRREDTVAQIGILEHRIEELRRNAFNCAQAKATASNRATVAENVVRDLGAGDQSEVVDYSGERAELAERIKRADAILAERDGLDRLTGELQYFGAARDVFAAFEWAAQQVQSEEVRRSGAALREPMAASLGRKVYIEPSKTACEIGWLDDAGNRVSVEALSGGQFAFFLAALQAAIVGLRGGALRTIIVDAGECDDETLAQLAVGMESFEGQVIAARWAQPDSIGGWSVVEM